MINVDQITNNKVYREWSRKMGWSRLRASDLHNFPQQRLGTVDELQEIHWIVWEWMYE